MKHIYGIFTSILLTAFLISGCGSDGSSKAESIIKDQTSVTEDYVNSLSSAKNSQDMVAAIEQYTEGMKKLIPKLKEFQKKYPEYQNGKVPESVEADMKKLEEISAKLPGAMMKTASYMMDGEVQAAMQKMGEEMSKMQ